MPDGIDPYKVLQVDSEAEDEVIQAAYRRLARKYHPDLADTPEAAARMAAINAAWEMIGDPASRAAYDRTRAATPAATGGASAAEPGGARRTNHRPATPPTPTTPAARRRVARLDVRPVHHRLRVR